MSDFEEVMGVGGCSVDRMPSSPYVRTDARESASEWVKSSAVALLPRRIGVVRAVTTHARLEPLCASGG